MTTPAGWYPDPAGGPHKRWWDGSTWTDHLEQPYTGAAAGQLTAPAGTKVYNVWIWLVVFLPYLSLPFLFTLDFSGFFTSIDPNDPSSADKASLALITSPGYLGLVFGGWLLGAATVVASVLDWRWLKAAGVPQPFHWAWAFFSLVGYPVYAIGRAVVTRRRTGQGIAVMWVTIGMIVLTTIVALVWAVSLVATIMATFPTS